jgi:glycosyltransferase involved in cell wall biosynthesis
MNVLLVTPSYAPIIGGSETLTHNTAIKLNEIGIRTDVLTLNMKQKWIPIRRKEFEEDAMFKVIKVPAINPFRSAKINPLYPLLRMNVIPDPNFIKIFREYDVIHFIGEADLTLPFCSFFGHVQKPKIMHHVGLFKGSGIYGYYNRHFVLKTFFERLFPRIADLYLVYADIEMRLLSDLGVPMPKISIIPMGIETKTYRPAKTERIDNLVLFVGRISEFKGLHILIKALSYLENPAQLTIIGPKSDVKYVREIEEMCYAVNEKGIHKIDYLGAMNETDLVPWYQKAAVVVCPYLVEASSLVTLEALSCGTPVIGTGSCFLENGVDGIVVTPRNPRKLADALKKLLEDKELREKYGREARRIVEERFSWECTISRLSKIYEALLNN